MYTIQKGGQTKENNLNQFIGATHEIVELVENNKREVSILEQKIVVLKSDLQTLEISRENIQNLISENIVQIEDTQGVTKALNDYYVKFISEAHMIYDYALKSYRGVEYGEENLEKISETDKKNKEKYTILTKMYNNQETELLKQLEVATINNCNAEEERKNRIAENVTLKQELSEIEKEMFVLEEEKSALDNETIHYNNDDYVCQLKEDIIKADNEIVDLTKKLKVAEDKQKEQDIILKTFEELTENLKELEHILIEKTAEFQNDLTENEEMKNNITKMEGLNKQAEKKIETLITQFKELQNNYEEYKHNFNLEIENYKENLNKNESYLKSDKEIYEKLITDEETLKKNLTSVEADIEAMKNIIHELEIEPKQDAKNELEVKEKLAKKLILKYETLNDAYKRSLAEKREEIEKDIVEIEIDNSKTESSIKLMEEEIKEIKGMLEIKMEEINKKKLELDKILQELIKEASIFKVVAPVLPQKRTRNWDSDTTMEDEDTSYADKVMMKVKNMVIKK